MKACSDNLVVKSGINLIPKVNYFYKDMYTEFNEKNFKLIVNDILSFIKEVNELESDGEVTDNFFSNKYRWDSNIKGHTIITFENIEGISIPKFSLENSILKLKKGFLIWNGYIFKEGYEFNFPLDLTNVKKCEILNVSIKEIGYDNYYNEEFYGIEKTDLKQVGDELDLDLTTFKELSEDGENRHFIKINSLYIPDCPSKFEENTEYYLYEENCYEEGDLEYFIEDAEFDRFLIQLISTTIPFGYIVLEKMEMLDEDEMDEENYIDTNKLKWDPTLLDTKEEFKEFVQNLKEYLK